MDTLLCNNDGDIIFLGVPSATDEVLAFHYGNFDNHYGDGTVGAAAANGRVYADTVPATLPPKFGTIGTPSTASGQTTYTWTPPSTSMNANVLLVAGGGGGGGVTGNGASGGGGAGGLVFDTDRTITSGSQTIVVGNGGTGGGNALVNGENGKNSTAFGLTANGGGGGGGSSDVTSWNAGSAGGSGGGGGGGDANPNGAGGASTQAGTNSGVYIDAGFAGGGSLSSLGDCGGGGGGAGEKGDDFLGSSVGNGYNIQGGDGLLLSVFGETYGQSGWFAGGGGAFARNDNIARAGGLGGGGAGGSSGTNHTGGGGGGRDAGVTAGNGGSGIVAIRYIADNNLISILPDGSTQELPVPSANYLLTNNISSTNGLYWIKPTGFDGDAFQVYCDLTGEESGIGSGGWMRVKYAADLYTQANPWTQRGGFAYSGDFTFTYTNEQINAMKATASEIRQTLDSYGKGSVGWTYGGGTFMGCKTLNGSTFNSTSGVINLPSNTDYSFNGWNSSGVITPRGTDPTDANDQVWRQGLIYLVESGNTYLPILGIYNRDVDAASEQRYFPLVSGDETFIWIR
jgi:hypothetical protein